MHAKLTLKLDERVVEQAKAYAEQRGVSLSRLVESYLAGLTRGEPKGMAATGVVAELEGRLAGLRLENGNDERFDYLMAKYN